MTPTRRLSLLTGFCPGSATGGVNCSEVVRLSLVTRCKLGADGRRESAVLLIDALDHTLLGRAQLGRERLTEVVCFVDLPDLQLDLLVGPGGAALGPLDGLFLRPDLDDPEACDHLLGREGAVDDGRLPPREP